MEIGLPNDIFEITWYWIGYYKLEYGKVTSIEVTEGGNKLHLVSKDKDGNPQNWSLPYGLLYLDPIEAISDLEKRFEECINKLKDQLIGVPDAR